MSTLATRKKLHTHRFQNEFVNVIALQSLQIGTLLELFNVIVL